MVGQLLVNDKVVGSEKDLSLLFEKISLAAMDPSQWGSVLRTYSELNGGTRGQLLGYDQKANIYLGGMYEGYSPESVKKYEEYYWKKNVWASKFLDANVGEVFSGDMLYPGDKLLQTEFYNDWIKPEEDIVAGAGVLLFKDEDRMFYIGGNIRRKDIDQKQTAMEEFFSRTTSHLQRSFEISRLLAGQSIELFAQNERKGLAGPQSVFIINNLGKIVYSSVSGEDELFKGKYFQYDRNGCLRTTSKPLQVLLNAHIVGLKLPVLTQPFILGSPDKLNEGIVECRVLPLNLDKLEYSPMLTLVGTEERCLVLVATKAKRSIYTKLQQVHRLTATEAMVAVMLANGMSRKEIAIKRDVSLLTVKNQLDKCFIKTGVHSQKDLVRIVKDMENS